MSKAKVVVIASAGLTTNLLVERLTDNFEVTTVFMEEAESKSAIIKRRIKRIGFIKTSGQVLFMLFVLPFIPNRKKQIDRIIAQHKLSGKPIDSVRIQKITSVHDTGLTQQVNAENPTLIFINGTRILKNQLLEQLHCPIVNIHVGITPKYRGVHGGFWAVRKNDIAHFGVTLHLVDAGIDTGKIIAQKVITPEKTDNFKTYPILQYCHGLDLLTANKMNLLSGDILGVAPLTEESELHTHPTIWEYLLG